MRLTHTGEDGFILYTPTEVIIKNKKWQINQ